MKNHKLNKKAIMMLLVVCIAAVAVLAGCGESRKSATTGTRIYYVDLDKKKLVNERVTLTQKDTAKLTEECLEKLTQNGKQDGEAAAVPEKVKINGYDITDRIATINFSEEYSMLAADREVLCRSAMVLTLTQIKGIDYVAFTVNDAPLRQKDGSLVGTMKASDFVADLGVEPILMPQRILFCILPIKRVICLRNTSL